MSRFDQPDAPDDDRFSDKPIDVQDEPQDGESWTDRLDRGGDLLRNFNVEQYISKIALVYAHITT